VNGWAVAGGGSHHVGSLGEPEGSVYYIEFFSRKPEVPLARFHEVVKRTQQEWMAQHPEDALVLCIGRTFRLGPRPIYMAVWKLPDFARLDAWKRSFREEQAAARTHSEFEDVAVIEDAGVYEEFGLEQL
jgi:hypothetical protein